MNLGFLSRKRSWFREWKRGLWSSFDGPWLDTSVAASDALLCDQHKQGKERVVSRTVKLAGA
jgi:hypothetical protein